MAVRVTELVTGYAELLDTHFLPLRIVFLTGANAREGCCSRGALDLNKMRVLFLEAQK